MMTVNSLFFCFFWEEPPFSPHRWRGIWIWWLVAQSGRNRRASQMHVAIMEDPAAAEADGEAAAGAGDAGGRFRRASRSQSLRLPRRSITTLDSSA